MAALSKKDRLIEEAQKFASRGQFDKAAKAYEQIIALEPSVVSQRQKLAELLIKCARNDDARKELETVASHFSKNGFYLKAIAVYKQLQKLFPVDISLSITLAELNEKHGLVANALAEYKLVYEQYEKSGKVPEALSILDRMQNADPQSIPIKIKLAEAYAQHEKKKEAYAVFSKAAALLIERSDNQALTKVCSRVQLLFPGKTDFLCEVLSELIRLGNAAAAIGSLQSLLRSDPGNKVVWELIIQAYKLLDQPQRVKIAYQHFLKYFPEEPAAILGLLSSITEEQNLAAALEILNKYESILISGGFLLQLEQAYLALDKLDPINMHVLEGLIRVATAAGHEEEITSFTSRLTSLRNVFPGKQNVSAEPEPEAAFPIEEPLDADNSDVLLTAVPQSDEDVKIKVEGDIEGDIEGDRGLEIEIEIEFEGEGEGEGEGEIEGDSSFGRLGEDSGKTSTDENWLDSVVALLDSVGAAPRGVKFGIEMENSDARSHFDLGQAFKEMGLFDEALNEFSQASQDLSLRLECLILQCVCLREHGDLERATTILQALLTHALTLEESCAVKYELASAYEAAGKSEEAHVLFNEINVTNSCFRDVNSRLNAVSTSNSIDFSDEDLDGFGLK
ncbi:MAG: tetratricopeptide repeat protein [Desulfuromonadaceae bacterium]